MLVDFVVLTLFIGLWTIIPQRIPPAVLPLALCLLIRSASNLILTYKRSNEKGLITSILALTFSGLQAQPLPASPKLVVTLTIDQLRTDYMEAFSSLYGEKGFKRLLREGKVFRQAEFPFAERTEPRPLPPSIPGQHRP